MKNLFCIIFLIFLVSQQVVAQQLDRATIEQRIQRYTKMKKTGTVLTIVGSALTITGIALMSSAKYETTTNYYGTQTTTSHDPNAIGGAFCLLGGLGMAGTGIPLMAVGSSRVKKYTAQLNTLSLNLKITPNGQAGVGFTYSF